MAATSDQQLEIPVSNTAPAVDGFKHDRLPDAGSYIRLLEFQLPQSPSETADIRCALRTFALAQTPPYTAISYTWGSPTPTATIQVNGRPMDVRLNCKAVLGRAQAYDPSVFYWIDAICINQTNLEEKGMQVEMMGKLYERSQRVMAYVGERADNSELLYPTLRRWKRLFRKLGSFVDQQQIGRVPRLTAHAYKALKGKGAFSQFFRELEVFVRRDYFRRVWVLQELWLGRQVDMHCGHDHLPIQVYRGAVMGLPFVNSDSNNTLWRAGYRNWGQIPALEAGSLSQLRRLDLLQLSEYVFRLACQDKRDKIYGILSMVDWGDDKPIWPDYTVDRFDLALETFQKIVRRSDLHNTPDFDLHRVARTVAQNLGLSDDPSTNLERAIQKRVTLGFMPLKPNFPVTGSHYRLSGLPLIRDDDGRWKFERPKFEKSKCGSDSEVEARGRMCSYPFQISTNVGTIEHPEEAHALQPNARRAVLIPQSAEPGDWCLFYDRSITGVPSYRTTRLRKTREPRVLIVREHLDGYFGIVGRGYATQKDCPCARSAWFKVHLATEDILVTESLWPGHQPELPQEHQRLRSYVNSGYCGSPGSSFAVIERDEKVPTHMLDNLSIREGSEE